MDAWELRETASVGICEPAGPFLGEVDSARTEGLLCAEMIMAQSGSLYVPGDLLVLLAEVDDLQKGFYVVRTLSDGWVVLRRVVDDEVNGRLWVTEHETALPQAGLELFMPVGIRLAEAH